MATASQQSEQGTVSGVAGSSLGERVARQYLACLAVLGHPEKLESFIKQLETTPNGLRGGYHLALALALQDRTDEALVHLRSFIAAKPGDANARKLAYRLLVHKARSMAGAQNWTGLSDVITEALTLAPPDTDPARELEAFKDALPMGHMRAGNRKEASAQWEQRFEKDPTDTRPIHNLALLHYWWARGAAQAAGSATLKQWQTAISYWVLLVNLEPFWNSWRETRKKAWGVDFPASELKAFREGILEEHMEHFFQAKADECAQKKDATGVTVYQDCLTSCLLEKKSAAYWRQALELLPADKSRPALVNLPAGINFFHRFGLLPQVQNAAAALAKIKGGAECFANLQIYFSGSGLGSAAVLSEERGRPEDALALLGFLPEAVQKATEARYVRALALVRLGTNLAGKKLFTRALEEWRSAFDLITIESKRAAKDSGFPELFGALKDSLSAQVVEAAQAEASRLKADEKLKEAIELLDRARPMETGGKLLDYLCIYTCERAGIAMGNKNWNAAREDFNRVLKLNPGFQRAVYGLSNTWNNEGLEKTNPDQAIPLFEKALEINPENYVAKRNLATDLRSKAVNICNNLNQYTVRTGIAAPLQMLERALNLVGSGLKQDVLTRIESLAGANSKVAHDLIDQLDDDLVKKILYDLTTVYGIRKRVRGY